MNKERMQVLEMLSAGTITPEDAESLLEKLGRSSNREASTQTHTSVIHLGPTESDNPPSSQAPPHSDPPPRPPAPRRPLRFLCIVINSRKNDVINIRLPIELVRTGLKLSTMIPEDAREKLRERGVDLGALSGLQGEELVEALRELKIDVDSGDGDVIRVYCE